MSAQPPFFGPIDLRAVQIDLQRLVDLLEIKGRGRGFDLSTAIVPTVDVGQIMELTAQREGFLRPFASPSEIPFRHRPVAGTPELPPHALGFAWYSSVGFNDSADVTNSISELGPLQNAAGFPFERALVRVAAVAAQITFSDAAQLAIIEVIGGTAPATTIHNVGNAGDGFIMAPAVGAAPFPLYTAFKEFSPPQRVIPNGGLPQSAGDWGGGPQGFLRLRRSVRGASAVAVMTTVVQVLAQISPAID